MTATQAATQKGEQEIRQVLDAYIAAFKRKDLEGIMALYAPDVVAFDVPPPLRYVGRDAYRQAWEKGLSMMPNDVEYETRDITIAISGDLAYCHLLSRMAMTMNDGQRMDSWMRLTWCLKRTQGRWLIVHEHGSFPIEMETEKAATNLKP